MKKKHIEAELIVGRQYIVTLDHIKDYDKYGIYVTPNMRARNGGVVTVIATLEYIEDVRCNIKEDYFIWSGDMLTIILLKNTVGGKLI